MTDHSAPLRYVYLHDWDLTGPWPSGEDLHCEWASGPSHHTGSSPTCNNAADIVFYFYSGAHSGPVQTCGAHLAYAWIRGSLRHNPDDGHLEGNHMFGVYDRQRQCWMIARRWQGRYPDLQPQPDWVDQQTLIDFAFARFHALAPATVYPPPCHHGEGRRAMSCSHMHAHYLAGGVMFPTQQVLDLTPRPRPRRLRWPHRRVRRR